MKQLVCVLSLLPLLAAGCHTSRMGSCPDGQCGAAPVPACAGGACSVEHTDPVDPSGGHAGLLGALHGYHHRGPQSHTGPGPGPAAGPSSPTVTYPYYTTRGPRDFLNPNPPSIGR
jgi:hypothetical protein